MRQQAEAYKVAGVDEDEPAFNPSKKRKEAAIEDVSVALPNQHLHFTDILAG